MNVEKLREFFVNANSCKIGFEGKCHDCGCKVCVKADLDPQSWKLVISGGALYQDDKKLFLKCDKCFKQDSCLRCFRECEVWSRVVGYLRPVSEWNDGKREEYKNRQNFMVK